MDEQLAQTQSIEALRRQVETSNNAARDAQALLRATQEQQQQYLRMPPPSTLPATTTGNIGSRIIPVRVIDAREAKIQFASMKVPKLTKTTLVNTEVHLFI